MGRRTRDSLATHSQPSSALLLRWSGGTSWSRPRRTGPAARFDGILLKNTLTRGVWEAKDSKDKLRVEIQKKIARGYPLDNILFELEFCNSAAPGVKIGKIAPFSPGIALAQLDCGACDHARDY